MQPGLLMKIQQDKSRIINLTIIIVIIFIQGSRAKAAPDGCLLFMFLLLLLCLIDDEGSFCLDQLTPAGSPTVGRVVGVQLHPLTSVSKDAHLHLHNNCNLEQQQANLASAPAALPANPSISQQEPPWGWRSGSGTSLGLKVWVRGQQEPGV